MRKTFAQAPDELTLQRARKGDMKALESIYRSFDTPVFTLGLRVCGRVEEAEEVLQETFLEVGRSIGGYRGEAPLGAWIKRIATSKALMRLRKQSRERETLVGTLGERDVNSLDPPAPSAGGAARTAAKVDLERALSRLPETARAVLWLHDVEGYTHEEIAELAGKTKSFSKSQLARAHARLRTILASGEGGWCHASES